MKPVLLVAALLTFAVSCQKNADDVVPPPADKAYIGKYLITKMIFKTTGHADKDMLATLPACSQDDLLSFEANSVFKTIDAGASCGQDPDDPTVWTVSGKKMTIDGVESDILSFNNHTLVLSTPMVFFGLSGVVEETLVKQ